jgi:hypothetical protein
MKHTTDFEVAVSHHSGQVTERHRSAQQQPATVLLEACGSAHFWARTLQQLAHSPILLPPQHVRPCVRRMLLIHGARAVPLGRSVTPSPRSYTWALKLERLRGDNKAAVALANKGPLRSAARLPTAQTRQQIRNPHRTDRHRWTMAGQ